MVSLPWQGSSLATASWCTCSLESSDLEEGIVIVRPGSTEGLNKGFSKSKISMRVDSGNVNLEVGQSDLLTKEMWEEKSPRSRMTLRFLASEGKNKSKLRKGRHKLDSLFLSKRISRVIHAPSH